VIDDSFAESAPLPAGTYDLSGTTLVALGEARLQASGEVAFTFEERKQDEELLLGETSQHERRVMAGIDDPSFPGASS
jgi:hypothetical protein